MNEIPDKDNYVKKATVQDNLARWKKESSNEALKSLHNLYLHFFKPNDCKLNIFCEKIKLKIKICVKKELFKIRLVKNYHIVLFIAQQERWFGNCLATQ